MNVLVACEESQAVCKAFRERGHRAFSCDLQECSGGHPEWHIQGDCLPLLNGNCTFQTSDTHTHTQCGKWDLIIAHPPCTRLCVTGNKWYKPEYADRFPNIHKEREEAIEFFMKFVSADCERIVIENPVGIMSTRWKKPSQIIQPYYFGEPFEKKTCLWIKGLQNLVPTNIVEPPTRMKLKSGKTMPDWYARPKMSKERQIMRSKTFPGIAEAMAEQWGKEPIYIPEQTNLFN